MDLRGGNLRISWLREGRCGYWGSSCSCREGEERIRAERNGLCPKVRFCVVLSTCILNLNVKFLVSQRAGESSIGETSIMILLLAPSHFVF